MNSNLPPGVSEFNIPGNTPEEQAWDSLLENIQNSGLTAQEARAVWEFGLKSLE